MSTRGLPVKSITFTFSIQRRKRANENNPLNRLPLQYRTIIRRLLLHNVAKSNLHTLLSTTKSINLFE